MISFITLVKFYYLLLTFFIYNESIYVSVSLTYVLKTACQP